MSLPPVPSKYERLLKILAGIIILIGIVVRIAVYLQNRDLFIDEANLARNVYERGFAELATPLSYEQYAPPLFMWMLKICTGIFGFGELAFRIYPLLTGIAALFVMFALLKEFTSYKTLWYPLALMAVAYMMIRYSSELKQYMPDVLITLSLIWLALKIDIIKTSTSKFMLLWLVAGSIGVWGSMPSVFILAGIGVYYAIIILQQKEYKKFIPLIIVSALWIAQFGYYYITQLKPQADSDYLQNFHRPFFLFATPGNKEEWQHNWDVVANLVQEAGGFTALALYFNLLMVLIAVVVGLKKDTARISLLIAPLFIVLLAAALNKYSLIPRVALFTMPLILLLAGYGLEQLMKLNKPVVYIPVIIIGVICIKNHNMLRMMWEPSQVEQMTDALDFVHQKNIHSGPQVYLHNGARPAYIYYTEIHPAKNKWADIKGGHLLWWDVNYDTLSANINQRSAFIFTSVSQEDLDGCKAAIRNHMHATDSMDKQGCHAYIYVRN